MREQYRELEVGEEIKIGDQVYFNGGWKILTGKSAVFANMWYTGNDAPVVKDGIYRRKNDA